MPSSIDTELLSPALLARLERLELVTRKVFRGRMKGERRSRRKGQSVEFADFRSYVHGDDPRFIDWNLYARLDRLFIKLFQEEEDLHFHALIDASQSMDFGDPTKMFVAKQIGAALGYVGLCRADRVRVAALGPAGAAAPTLRGRGSVYKMLDYLQQVKPEHNVSLADGIRDFTLRATGTGVVMLITDLLDKNGYESALRMLLARRMDVYLVHLLAPEDLDPEIAGDLRLVDSEDGDIAEVTVSKRLLQKYKETVAAFQEQARAFCSRRNITYMPVRSDQPVERLVTGYLRQRGLVR